MSKVTEEQKLNLAVNFFIGVTLLNETLIEVFDSNLFSRMNKIEGKRLLNYFSPVEKKLFKAFNINMNVEEELEFQLSIKNMGDILSEVVDLNGDDIKLILDGIKNYKKELKNNKEQEIS